LKPLLAKELIGDSMSVEIKKAYGGKGHDVFIDDKKVLYVAPKTMGETLTALEELKEHGDIMQNHKIKMGHTELEVHKVGFFNENMELRMLSREYPESVLSTFANLNYSELGRIKQALQDRVDKADYDNLRRIRGNQIE
jgi:hypothetical protein